MSKPDDGTLLRLYVHEGMSIATVAARFDVAPQTAHSWLVAAGVPRRQSAAEARDDIADEEIVSLYCDEGLPAIEVGARLGCSPSLVYYRLDRLGIPRRSRGTSRPRPGASELAEHYVGHGLSLSEVGALYGVSAQAVHRWLDDAGIDRRPAAQRTEGPFTECVELYQAGWSAPAIADRLGLSSWSIYRHFDRAGVARRAAPTRVTRDELVAALAEGLSAPTIADALGVSVACVCRTLSREGLMTAAQAARRRRALRRSGGELDDGL